MTEIELIGYLIGIRNNCQEEKAWLYRLSKMIPEQSTRYLSESLEQACYESMAREILELLGVKE
jgi:hypothetical protein